MTQVHVILRCVPYEGADIISIHSTRELAEASALLITEECWFTIDIESYELDEE